MAKDKWQTAQPESRKITGGGGTARLRGCFAALSMTTSEGRSGAEEARDTEAEAEKLTKEMQN